MADPNVDRALAEALRDPTAWLGQADQLKRAADVLLTGFHDAVYRWARSRPVTQKMPQLDPEVTPGIAIESTSATGFLSSFSLGPVYLMVAGYAIENLAKGLVIARDPTGATVDAMISQHISTQLLEHAGVSLVDDERDLVERMSLRVKWGGRYHAPKRSGELAAARAAGFTTSPLRLSTADGAIVNVLFERMRRELAKAEGVQRA